LHYITHRQFTHPLLLSVGRDGDQGMAKVMLVDDETILLDILGAIVEDLGHEPLYAINGEEAWEILINQFEVPALIITDRMMPVMNGVELIERVRNSPRLRKVPIILTSAAGSGSAGHLANSFMPKPYDLQTLEAQIEGYLQHLPTHSQQRTDELYDQRDLRDQREHRDQRDKRDSQHIS
jgi:CheY-like chemotaxis protein